jgi:methyl acetate hydrolase
MFLNGGRVGSTRILSEASIGDMTYNQIGRLVVSTRLLPTRHRRAGRDTWGLGFQVAARPTSPTQRGARSYGWPGIASTHFWVDPTRRLGVVLLTQGLPFYDDACIRPLTDLEDLVSRFPKQ